MSTHLRFGALQLACRHVASDNKLLSAAVCAAANSCCLSASSIGEEAHHRLLSESRHTASIASAVRSPSAEMLLTAQSASRMGPSANAPPSMPAPSARSSAFRPATPLFTSGPHRSSPNSLLGLQRQAAGASVMLDSLTGSHAAAQSLCLLRSLSTHACGHAAAASSAAALRGPTAVAATCVPPSAERPHGASSAATGVASGSGRPSNGLSSSSTILTRSLASCSASSSSGLITSLASSSLSSSSSSRGFGSSSSSGGSWGGGGGGMGGGPPDGPNGLPPPVIISPVALRVVVIGWMGSSKRYLNKYGALWARSGDHEVLLVRPSVAQTLVRWRGVVVAGRDIDRVAQLHRENPAMPTVYHIFSTGGFIHAGTMWRWMDEVEDVAQRRDMLEEVRAIIFDSAPASVNPDMASRAIVSAVTHTPAEELSPDMPGWKGALLGGTRSFLQGYLKTKGVQLRTEEVYDAWYNLAPVCPQLYLYSDADPLVPAADVERYMAVQEGRGVEVSGFKWGDSGHVEHCRRHPHEYAYQISAFLARALKDW